ncbi:hypothetical protein FQA39_LY00806 [Lamprigera yunnana]|nr:hypothetical protein FQA39_LY00806 [Lamprigera yunnana]
MQAVIILAVITKGYPEIKANIKAKSGVNEATFHVVTTLGAVNLEYFLWRVIGKVNSNYGGTAFNVSGMHEL